jgi:hypothetical protein
MRYLTWKLKVFEGGLVGPEPYFLERNSLLEAGWSKTDEKETLLTLGYWSGEDFDLSELAGFDIQELTAEDALAFCKSLNVKAYFTEDNRIGVAD